MSTAQEKGRYLLLQVGKSYEARTLSFAIDKALAHAPLNGKERVCLVSLKVQISNYREYKRGKTS